MKLKGPYEIEAIVYVTDGKGQVGKINVSIAKGELPTQEDLDEGMDMALKALKGQGFRLMDKSEFFNQLMHEKFGTVETFATPGGNTWDK